MKTCLIYQQPEHILKSTYCPTLITVNHLLFVRVVLMLLFANLRPLELYMKLIIIMIIQLNLDYPKP